MKVSRWLMPLVTLVALFGTIGIAQVAGWWSASGRQVVVAATLGVDDLKGWMTIQQAADGLGVPATTVIEAIGAAPEAGVTPATRFKDVEALVPGFELSSFREVLAERLALAPSASPSPR